MVIKKKRLNTILEIVIIFFIGFLLGGTSGSPFYGDVNVIDEGQFAAWANHMLHGKFLFKDIYVTYGPLYVYPLYLLSKIFGPSMFLVRAYITIGALVGIYAVNEILKQFKIEKLLRYLTLVLFALLPIMQIRQAVGYIILLFLFKGIETRKLRWFFFCGISLATCFLISPEIGIFSAIIIFLYYSYTLVTADIIRIVFQRISVFLLGILFIVIPFSLWTEYEGWLTAYIVGTEDILTSLSGINSPNGQNFPNPYTLFPVTLDPILLFKFIFSQDMMLYWTIFIYLLIVGYIVIRMALQKRDRKDVYITMIGLYGVLMYTILLSRNGIGHFFFTLSPLIILIVYFIDKALRIVKQKKSKRIEKSVALIGVLAISLFVLRLLAINRPEIIKKFTFPFSVSLFKQNPVRFGPMSVSSVQEQQLSIIQNYILQQTTEKDNIFLFSNEPVVYMLVDRINPTRYDLPFVANPLEKRLELIFDLTRNPPRYIIENQKSWAVDGVSNRQRLPEVYEYLEKQYHKTAVIGNYIVYEINRQ